MLPVVSLDPFHRASPLRLYAGSGNILMFMACKRVVLISAPCPMCPMGGGASPFSLVKLRQTHEVVERRYDE